jgi:hypothetical protein
MPELVLDSATRRRVVEQGTFLLRAFHESEERNEGGRESISRRGQLAGFRHTLGIIIGTRAASEVMEAVREQSGLGFPHVGPVTDDGSILGFDSEAQMGL